MEFSCDLGVVPKAMIRIPLNAIGDYFRCTNETVIVKLQNGQIKGVKRKSVYDGQYYSFEGIPYGKPPLGDLRFKAPQPAEPWTGIRDCTKGCKVPIQYAFPTAFVKGSEDCLYLNVYTRKLHTNRPRPVLVFLPGGGFQLVEATRFLHGPDYLMQKDIVLVAINYRIGALGFLSLSDPTLKTPGNAGIHDQILALRWVQNNIQHFNGDPHNVTLMGQSAGAVSAHYLMCFEQARYLFHKAILLSSSALVNWSVFPRENWAYRLACELGYKGLNLDKNILAFLLKVDAKKMPPATHKLLTEAERRALLWFDFGPVIEPYKNENSLITKAPEELLKTAWGNEIPLIFGNTSFEGLGCMSMLKKYPYLLNDLGDCESFTPIRRREEFTKDEQKKIGLEVKRVFFGNVTPNFTDHIYEYLDIMSYALFVTGIYRTVPARLRYARNAPSYLYRFDFDSPDFNHIRQIICGMRVRGASHTDDCSYIFHNWLAHKLTKNSAEYLTIQRMTGIIAAFMETSNPNCWEIKPTIWKPLSDEQNPMCLNISNKVEFIELPEKFKYEFWRKVFSIKEEF